MGRTGNGSHRSSGVTRLGLYILVALGVLSFGLQGCAEEDSILLIRGAAKLDSSCTPPASQPESFSGGGVLDVSLAQSYLITPFYENVAGPAPDNNGLNNEGNRIIIKEAQIEVEALTDLPGSVIDTLSGFAIPVAGNVLDPGATGSISIPVLNSFQIQQLAGSVGAGQTALIVVKLTLSGTTTSSTDVESNTLEFPIEVCNGCLAVADCETEGQAASNVCVLPGQDVPFCPPEEEMMTEMAP